MLSRVWSCHDILSVDNPFTLHTAQIMIFPSLTHTVGYFFYYYLQSHGFAQLSLTRPGPKSTGLPNVLYCGASTRPGNGVPLVLIGAKQVAEKAVFSLRTTDNAD